MDGETDEVSEDRYGRMLRWMRWLAIVPALLVLYFFIFPIPLVFLDDRYDLEWTIPQGAYRILEGFVAPIVYLIEIAPPYGAYIDWIQNLVD